MVSWRQSRLSRRRIAIKARRAVAWPVLVLLAVLVTNATLIMPPANAAPTIDQAPRITTVLPLPDAVDVPPDTTLTIPFSEPVDLPAGAIDLQCTGSGGHAVAIEGDGTVFSLRPVAPFWPGERCVATVFAERVSDRDTDDPPDLMTVNYTWSFTIGADLAAQVVINELDAITAEGRGEFIELYDGGVGATSLTGLVVVLYRADATVYLALDLAGYQTDAAGYFLLGTRDLTQAGLVFANGLLVDGFAAVAVFAGEEADFPPGAAVSTGDLLDAVVYAGVEPADPSLFELLEAGQPAPDEAGRGQAEADAIGRCPDGAGGGRHTDTFVLLAPTPGGANACPVDDPPRLLATSPPDGATGVDPEATVTITFSEPVILPEDALDLQCTISGAHSLVPAGVGPEFVLTPVPPFAPGEGCVATIFGERVRDVDTDDPPDLMTADYSWRFTIRRPVAGNVLINEVDADTPGADTAEFIELYDGGVGQTALDGLALVLFNGQDDSSYRTIPLDGYATDDEGYFLAGGTSVAGAAIRLPDGWLQNGPDAVALVAGSGRSWPNGSPLPDDPPLDALVYGPGDMPDGELLALLDAGQPQVDENGRGDADHHSLQRCPNGAGGGRRTAGYRPNVPTPGATNNCITDAMPQIAGVVPAHAATGVKVDAVLTVEFTEAVGPRSGWLAIECAASGGHAFNLDGGPMRFTIRPVTPFAKGDTCVATVFAEKVSDLDDDDPPDLMAADYTWQFMIEEPVADFIVINEIDANTPGSDDREFIELYDGGAGGTRLDGLVLVLFNGSSLVSYRTIDLAGLVTDARGYLLVGNTALRPELEFRDGLLQNGPDAVAVYAAARQSFPNDSPLVTDGLVDAVVYGDPAKTPPALLRLLLPGQRAADENARGADDDHSLQRCPNGAGGQRRTASFVANRPTPRSPSDCITDSAPAVLTTTPANGAQGVGRYTDLAVVFNEPVALAPDWLRLACTLSGRHALTLTGGPSAFQLRLEQPFALGDSCQGQITAAAVRDADRDDPPDNMAAEYTWRFEVARRVADTVLINEIDSDTPGSDTAEFIELYDGGRGGTDLSGLIVVLFNGNDDRSYRTIDLQGRQTDARGYFVIGNSGVPARQLDLPDGTLQNGPDAVGLFERAATALPNGSPIDTWGLVDAIVYSTADPADAELYALLNPGQPQADESGRGAGSEHSLQRCPDGGGGPRNTLSFLANRPTAGQANQCAIDAAPRVESVQPGPGTAGVALNPTVAVTFTEAVSLDAGWVEMTCAASGKHVLAVSAGPRAYRLALAAPLAQDEACRVIIKATRVRDLDEDDPPDAMVADYVWEFRTAAAPVADFVLINEVDANTPGSDTAEFIELYDGGRGNTDLSGLVLVFWNGRDDRSYRALALDGFRTDARGYFVAGNSGVANAGLIFGNGALQNGPDGVALYRGRAADFPNGSALATGNLLDALVYGPDDDQDEELIRLLNPGQVQADENARGAGDTDSLQRCPDGSGGQRNTAAVRPAPPTPGAANRCASDQAPAVVSVRPAAGAIDVPLTASLQVAFSEAVTLDSGAISLDCVASGHHSLSTSGGARVFDLTPAGSLRPGERCRATVLAAKVHDRDRDDPPDGLAADFDWQFTTIAAPPVADFVLINEVDANTPGSDTAEFIELYDGGRGNTDLSGLVLVFWNGRDDKAYRAMDLSGYRTDAAGYFVAGNPGVSGAGLSFGNGALQNGPDAVALYRGRAADFPNGTILSTRELLDAVVYGPGSDPDAGLLALLNPGQPQVDEDARGAAPTDSLQRCPDGGGGQRNTITVRPSPPTPGAANRCVEDAAPWVEAVFPTGGAAGVPVDVALAVSFSEAVTVENGWLALVCAAGGDFDLRVSGGPRAFTAVPAPALPYDDTCTATVTAAAITDRDTDDLPDHLAADFTWQFTTAAAPPGAISVAFSHNGPLWIGQAAAFTNASAGPAPLAFRWDFGDGNPPSTETHPRHTYDRPGRYTVSLTARHGSQEATATAEVEVRPRLVFLPATPGSTRPTGQAVVYLPLAAGR